MAKAVFFDFDGTITKKSPNIWKSMWSLCGFSLAKGEFYSCLFNRFMSGEINHQEWCDITTEKFRAAGLAQSSLEGLASKIELIDGLENTLKVLKQKGYSLHIVSGNVLSVIKYVLQDMTKYFDTINANDITFDSNGLINHIQGTNYDFEGKAKFIQEYKEKTSTPARNLIFVGNGSNDEWAHLSGCKTICIKPDETDYTNNTKWHLVRQNITNLTDILQDID